MSRFKKFGKHCLKAIEKNPSLREFWDSIWKIKILQRLMIEIFRPKNLSWLPYKLIFRIQKVVKIWKSFLRLTSFHSYLLFHNISTSVLSKKIKSTFSFIPWKCYHKLSKKSRVFSSAFFSQFFPSFNVNVSFRFTRYNFV